MVTWHQVGKTSLGVWRIGRCDKCGQTRIPLIFYPPTGEQLDELCLNDRVREPVAAKREIEEDRLKDTWDELTGAPPKE
jgi:hypothetical protein